MTLDIEKIKAAALAAQVKGRDRLSKVTIFHQHATSAAVLELITQLEETQADLAHANSILIKIEKLLEGVEYRGDYAEGVHVLVTQQAAQIERMHKAIADVIQFDLTDAAYEIFKENAK